MDAGAPISYEVLTPGTPVYSSDAELIGSVAHVLADEKEDVFDGVVIAEGDSGQEGGVHERHLSGNAAHRLHAHDHRFVDADDIASIHERALTLKLDAAAARQLPHPSPSPAVMSEDPADAPSHLQNKLLRAWDLISGNY